MTEGKIITLTTANSLTHFNLREVGEDTFLGDTFLDTSLGFGENSQTIMVVENF